jgi:hypothetical protein
MKTNACRDNELMLDVWQLVGQLKGSTLLTSRGNAFIVDSVTDTAMFVTPVSTGRLRRIPRAEIEKTDEVEPAGSELRPVDVRNASASEYNPAYCAAIVNAARALN